MTITMKLFILPVYYYKKPIFWLLKKKSKYFDFSNKQDSLDSVTVSEDSLETVPVTEDSLESVTVSEEVTTDSEAEEMSLAAPLAISQPVKDWMASRRENIRPLGTFFNTSNFQVNFGAMYF